MLNVDWFNPFKKGLYSAGAIYLSILNLPRLVHFKEENSILIGLIPGPKEPSLTINSYIAPLVNELEALRDGVWMECPGMDSNRVKVIAKLICLSSDIPATRNIAGHLGIKANKACQKCLKDFLKIGDKSNYSGVDCTNWELRNSVVHRQWVKQQSEKKEMQSKYGIRYSTLLDLKYFDIIRYACIDPMHNLLLGTAKHMMQLWTSRGSISEAQLLLIQRKAEQIIVPVDMGRIPVKIASSFAIFKADEWKHWCLVYSLYCLFGILPSEELKIWSLFIQACKLLFQHSAHIEQAKKAHSLLINFISSLEEFYGWEVVL